MLTIDFEPQDRSAGHTLLKLDSVHADGHETGTRIIETHRYPRGLVHPLQHIAFGIRNFFIVNQPFNHFQAFILTRFFDVIHQFRQVERMADERFFHL